MRNKLTVVEEKRQLTVRELIKLLEQYPDDSKVWVEGCDCVGESGSVDLFKCFGEQDGVIVNRLV